MLAAVLVIASSLAAGCGGGDDGPRAPQGGRAAGIPSAAPPPTAVPTRFEGRRLSVPLTRRRPAPVRRACREAQRAAAVPVVCPSLVPDVPMVSDRDLHGGAAPNDAKGFYLFSFNNGENGRALHFILGLGDSSWLRRWVFDDRLNEVKGEARRLPDVVVDGTRVELYRLFGGPNAGHVGALVHRPDGLQAFASMHGREHADAAVLMALDLGRQPAGRTP